MGFKCDYKLNTATFDLVENVNKLQEYKKMAEDCGFPCMLETRNLYIFSKDKQFCLGLINKPLTSPGYSYETFEDVQITQDYSVMNNVVVKTSVNVVTKTYATSFNKMMKQVKKLEFALKEAYIKQRMNAFEGDFSNV